MPTVHIDVRQIAGIGDLYVGDKGVVDLSPYRPYVVDSGDDDYLVSSEKLTVTLTDGVVDVVLPQTPVNNALKVQLRNVKNYGVPFYVQIPAGDCNLFELAHIDKDTLDPVAEPDAAWAVALNAEEAARIAEDVDLQAQIDGIGTGAVSSVNTQIGDVVLDQDDIADGTTAKQYTATEQTKLAGVATGATANSTDAQLRDRATHAGVQAQSTVTDLVADLGGKQPLDADLTTIAALDSGTAAGVMATEASGWVKRTYAQVKTSLGLTKSDVGLSDADNTSDANKPVSSAQAAADTAATAAAQATSAQRASNLSDLASAATARTNLGLGTAATQATGAFDAAGSAAAAQAASQPLDTDLTTIAGLTATTDNVVQSVGSAWASRTPAQLKSTLALAKGDVGLSNVDNVQQQPIDSDLTTIAALDSGTSTGVMATEASGWVKRTYAQIKTSLGLVKADVGLSNVDNVQQQPLDADLTTIAGLTATTDNIIQSVGSAWASRTPAQVKAALAIAQSDVTNLVTDLGNKQPLDSDLTTIAGLTATTDNMIQSVGSAWASRTPTQVKTALALENVSNTSNATERAAVRTLTNARITKRVFSTADTATLTIDSDSYDGAKVTALAQAMTIAAPTGTPTVQQGLIIRLKDNGTARALTWNAAFRAIGVTLPTTTVISKTTYVGCIWNTDDSKWDAIAVATQA